MDRMLYVYIGFVPMFIVFMLVSLKKLRDNSALKIALSVTLPFAAFGVFNRTPEAAMFSGAFIQVISYACLRLLFKRKYHFEPTYNRSGWYDAEDGRRQNWFDVLVFIIPLMLSFVLPLVIIILKYKFLFTDK